MKNKKKLIKRSLSMFLALIMCLGMLQTTVFAVEDLPTPEITDTSEGTSESEEANTSEETNQSEDTNTSEETNQSEDTNTSEETNESEDANTSEEANQSEDTNTSEETNQSEDTNTSEETNESEDANTSEETNESEDTNTSEETDESEDTNVPEDEVTQESEEVPAEVQEFLNAVAALPDVSEVNAENAEAIGNQVNAVIDMYNALDEEFCEREDVCTAYETVQALFMAVLETAETEEIPAEVQEFLDAVAALPDVSEVNAENVEAIGNQVNVVLDMYEALIDAGLGERDDVTEALNTVYAIYEAVLAMEKIPDGDTYNGTAEPDDKPTTKPNANNIDVYMFCDSYLSNSRHFGHAGYLSRYTDMWSLGEVVPCDWMDGYEWFCPLNMDMSKWTSFYNRNYGTHMFSMFGHGYDRQDALKYTIPASELGFYWNGKAWDFYQGYLFIVMTEYSSQIDYTVVHEYYTNGKFDGSVSETRTNAKTGTKIYPADLAKKTTYEDNAYEYKSGTPDPLVCCDDVTANVITLRYERNHTYTVTYTDDVAGETVFPDQGYEGLKEGDETPAFSAIPNKTETVKKDGKDVVQPIRNGYIFQGWSPAVNPVVDRADDDDEDYEIVYYATWQEVNGLTVSKTPSEEYPYVGDEFSYTIKVENPNSVKVKVKITDVLNGKLNFVAAGDGGAYDKDTRTVTWTDVTVPANGSKEVTLYVKANAAGKIYNEAEADWETGNTSGNTTVEAQEPESNDTEYIVTVRYMDDQGNPINGYPNVTVDTTNGGEYDVTDKKVQITDYTFKEVQGGEEKLQGTVTDNSTVIVLVYTKNNTDDKDTIYTLTVKYVYENGDTAATTYTSSLKKGDPYSVGSPSIIGYTPDKVLVSGVMPDKNMEFIVVYKTVNNPRPNPPEPNDPEPNRPEPNEPDPNPPEPNQPESNEPESTQPVAEITYIPYAPVVNVLMAGVPGDVVDIAETDVPLAAAPDGVVDIFDTEVPLAAVPKTGDLSQLWYMAAILSAAGLLMMAALGRRERKQHKEK